MFRLLHIGIKYHKLTPAVSRQLVNLSTKASKGPSTTTTIQLRKLPSSLTETSLKTALGSLNYRKLELEPGCAIHLLNEAEADCGLTKIKQKFGCESKVISSRIPALLLQNLPENINVELLQNVFGKFFPKVVNITGGVILQTIMNSSENALKAVKIIEQISIDGNKLKTQVVKLSNNSYSVQIYNIHLANEKKANSNLTDALSIAFPDSNISSLSKNGSSKSFNLRFSKQNQNPAEIASAISKLNFEGHTIEISSPKELKKPALFLRKIRSVGDKAIMSLLEGSPGLFKVQMQRRSADVQADMAVAYFSSEESAFQTLSKIKNISIEGKNISVAYREIEEPAVIVSNLSSNVSVEELQEMFKLFRPSHIDMKGDHAIVYLDSPKDVKLASNSLSSKILNGNKITVKSFDLNDIGYSLKSSTMTKEQLNKSLTDAGLVPTAITMNTNISAFIGFLNMDEAIAAQSSFINGSVSIDAKDSLSTSDSGLVTSSISVQPSFVLQVQNLSRETSVKQCEDVLSEGGITNPLSTDRSAILKFKRHSEVVPGMKTLKTISAEGDVKFSIHRYRPVISMGTSEYDENGIDEDFDKFSLRAVLKDYMHSEPATRFQIARNTFDRALKDAKSLQNISFLLDTSSTESIKEEARSILKQKEITPEANSRLFELFLQRDDMASFCADFKDMNAFFGEKNESNPFDWSQFRIETGDDIDRLTADMREHEKQSFSLNNGNITRKSDSKTIVINEVDGDKGTVISLEDPLQLKDKEGRLWSGAILNTDTVQKPMPGNRVNSHRALVVVGNMKGACGFGMGKGKTGGDAVNAAFRDALRNLVYIDLYDNFGLAHDVHGKHNSCHAYIKSTPKSRMMVASPFATAVLTRFGISSASCKLVGRRDPYAMVNALFNALKQHENVDEFAKDRGKRYLSLKWAYDNQI